MWYESCDDLWYLCILYTVSLLQKKHHHSCKLCALVVAKVLRLSKFISSLLCDQFSCILVCLPQIWMLHGQWFCIFFSKLSVCVFTYVYSCSFHFFFQHYHKLWEGYIYIIVCLCVLTSSWINRFNFVTFSLNWILCQ